jgi:hypothetical protein
MNKYINYSYNVIIYEDIPRPFTLSVSQAQVYPVIYLDCAHKFNWLKSLEHYCYPWNKYHVCSYNAQNTCFTEL